MKRNILKILKWMLIGVFLFSLVLLLINFYIILSTKNQIIDLDDASSSSYDAILVLGAAIWGNQPSPMLEDRLNYAISLYKKNNSVKLIMSGDHGTKEYNEVQVMKNYAIEQGVPSEDIFMDHAGFSSYDSIYRAKEIFGVEKVVIITQKYHLYRALYIANQIGLEARGVSSDPRSYRGQFKRELREVLARDKDFFKCILKPTSTYLGEKIPIYLDGNVKN